MTTNLSTVTIKTVTLDSVTQVEVEIITYGQYSAAVGTLTITKPWSSVQPDPSGSTIGSATTWISPSSNSSGTPFSSPGTPPDSSGSFHSSPTGIPSNSFLSSNSAVFSTPTDSQETHDFTSQATTPSHTTATTSQMTSHTTIRPLSQTHPPTSTSSTGIKDSAIPRGVSSSAVAGIAIACLVAGAVLAALAGLWLLRRRNRDRSQPESTPVAYHAVGKGDSGEIAQEKFQLGRLLDPTPDNQLSTELRSLDHSIRQHVESHYHLQANSLTSETLVQALRDLGLEQGFPIPSSQLASLALDPATRYIALRHFIAQTAFSSVSIDRGWPVSLLPSPVTSLMSAMPPVENHHGSQEALAVALTKWRFLSAFLLHPRRSDRSPLSPTEEVSTHQAQQLAMALNTFLEHFMAGDREARYEQENHLREVIAEIATFGYVVLSQPSEHRFIFDARGRRNDLVVCPGLEKISDEEGHRLLNLAHTIVAPVVESI
ncbi:hypothetical protein F4778DRAFT_184769 [Xylariomycetidae sp. FL2044]|nr:hypothetical protein F4778DRAFT_184769 [Xylariomycetidae sp. FL2044]